MKKQTRKLFCLIVSLVLLTTFLLVSCGDKDDDTSSEAVESGESVVDHISEPVSDTESQAESFEESSEEPSKDESSEESSEPDYQAEMTEEMANAFLKLIGDNRTAQEYMTGIKWGENEYMRAYAIYGNLNGYILCSMSNWVASTMTCTYTAGDYTFTSGNMWSPSELGLYLYKDLTFITFEEAYESGLFDAKDAYELINAYSGPESVNPIEAKRS